MYKDIILEWLVIWIPVRLKSWKLGELSIVSLFVGFSNDVCNAATIEVAIVIWIGCIHSLLQRIFKSGWNASFLDFRQTFFHYFSISVRLLHILLQKISFRLEGWMGEREFRETDKNRKIGIKINLCGFQQCVVSNDTYKNSFGFDTTISSSFEADSNVLDRCHIANTYPHENTFSPYAPLVYIYGTNVFVAFSQHFVAVDGYEFYLSS